MCQFCASRLIRKSATSEALADLIPQHANTIRIAMIEDAETDRDFAPYELDEILHHMKDTAPGVDSVCYSIIKIASLSTRYILLRLIN